MTPNELLKQWGIREGLPETFGAGAWYDNTVRVVEHDGEPCLEWHDQQPVRLAPLSDTAMALISAATSRLAPKSVAVRMFALQCKLDALTADFVGIDASAQVFTADPEAVAQAVTDAITDAITDAPAADEPPAPPKRASRKRGEVA